MTNPTRLISQQCYTHAARVLVIFMEDVLCFQETKPQYESETNQQIAHMETCQENIDVTGNNG